MVELRDLLPKGSLKPGTYKMHFNAGAYHAQVGVEGFYPSQICLSSRTPSSTTIPLLLSPFGYSTYRGSEPKSINVLK